MHSSHLCANGEIKLWNVYGVFFLFNIWFFSSFQIRNIRKVIQLTKDSLDELNKKFGNDQQPNPMYVEVRLFLTTWWLKQAETGR